MKWIVGLGNPGAQYQASPHNIGFDVVEELARRWSIPLRLKASMQAELGEGMIASKPVTLVRPLTFMNRSGEAMAKILRQREWTGEDLLVVFDDVNLPIGRMRLRVKGSHGGQNGMRSVIERLGTDEIARLRVGIRPPWEVDNLARYVLAKLPPAQREQLAIMAGETADAVECWLKEGTVAVTERFNGLRKFDETA